MTTMFKILASFFIAVTLRLFHTRSRLSSNILSLQLIFRYVLITNRSNYYLLPPGHEAFINSCPVEASENLCLLYGSLPCQFQGTPVQIFTYESTSGVSVSHISRCVPFVSLFSALLIR